MIRISTDYRTESSALPKTSFSTTSAYLPLSSSVEGLPIVKVEPSPSDIAFQYIDWETASFLYFDEGTMASSSSSVSSSSDTAPHSTTFPILELSAPQPQGTTAAPEDINGFIEHHFIPIAPDTPPSSMDSPYFYTISPVPEAQPEPQPQPPSPSSVLMASTPLGPFLFLSPSPTEGATSASSADTLRPSSTSSFDLPHSTSAHSISRSASVPAGLLSSFHVPASLSVPTSPSMQAPPSPIPASSSLPQQSSVALPTLEDALETCRLHIKELRAFKSRTIKQNIRNTIKNNISILTACTAQELVVKVTSMVDEVINALKVDFPSKRAVFVNERAEFLKQLKDGARLHAQLHQFQKHVTSYLQGDACWLRGAVWSPSSDRSPAGGSPPSSPAV